ncbi:MAG: HGGxSTG domain-containing protein [Proteobacteria bacterium]|nr:HGGxSTG domain-containing protein [Pseudomonadota bacterium]
MLKPDNRKTLIEAGCGTRLGAKWPGQRCLAKTRQRAPCQNPVVTDRNRCRMHGGKSTGPRTPEGKARVAAAHTKHGRRSKAHVEKVRYINAEIRRITYELKRGGWIP